MSPTEGLPCQREAFSLPPGLHYLDCAYQSPLPRVVEEAGVEGIRRKRDPTSVGARDFFADSDELRRLFARLVGAPDPTSIAILPSVSYGIAVAARNAGVRAGQNVVVAAEQFPSNVYAWIGLAERVGAEVRVVAPPGGESRGRGWNQRLLEAIDDSTGVVSVAPAHWTDGTRFDLVAIGERAREVGALFVVDGTQWVGAAPFDVGEVRPDALICAGYKWLLGPYSLGVGYFGPRLQEGEPLEETWIAREGSEDFQGLVDYRGGYQPGAIRFDVGERSNFILIPMLVAALRLILEWRPERIAAYCRALTDRIAADAAALGYRAEEPEWRSPHILGLRMPPALDLGTVRGALAHRGVSASLRGSALRVSPNVYNEEADAGALLEALVSAAS